MRIFLNILTLILLVDSSYAYARGGPSGAFGDVLEMMLLCAIVGGLVAGAFWGCVFRRRPWITSAILSMILVTIGLVWPIHGLFFCVPGIVFVVMFVSVSDIVVHNGLFHAKAVVSLSRDGNNRLSKSRAGVVRYILRWITGMYVFLATVSLLNFDLLGFLAIPPVVFPFLEKFARFFPFVLPPLAVAVGTAIIVTVLYLFIVSKTPNTNPYVVSFIFNSCILFTFLTSAEIYRYHLMTQALLGHIPNQLHSSSFLGSVLSYRTYYRGAHATFKEGGRTYFWSYSERKFIQEP